METKKIVIATFNKTFCLKLILLGLFLTIASTLMANTTYILFGIVIPTHIRVAVAILGILMGLWFLYAGIERFFSDDPAISMDDNNYYLHVNPGRKLTLPMSSFVGISKPIDLHGVKKYILGSKAMYIHTDFREAIWASSIIIGSGLITEDLSAIYDNFANSGYPTNS